VKLVADCLAEDRRAKYEEISQATVISPKSVFRILTKDLQKIKIYARWFPHCLPAEQKQRSVEITTLLKQRFNVESQAFLCRIVAVDEMWVIDFELPNSLLHIKISTRPIKDQANDVLCLRTPTNHDERCDRFAE